MEGDVDDLVPLEVADTAPVSITGATSDVVTTTTLELPDGVQVLGSPTVTVTVTFRPVTATRTFEAGLLLVGARADRDYALSTDRVLVTIGGSVADLDRLSGAALAVTLDVSGLDSRHARGERWREPRHRPYADRRQPGSGDGDDHRRHDLGQPGALTRRTDPARQRPSSNPEDQRPVPRLFGTDGIRGVANVELKPTIAYALGRATAHRLAGRTGAIVVGQDTRRSGDLFVAAITAGATSLGADVHRVGVVPTPALAFLAGTGEFAAGIMVSASHNPASDNGLEGARLATA